jgi:arylsulfatase A-like enzyme
MTLRQIPPAALLAVAMVAAAPAAESKPNIVFILADDLGYGDTGCYGATKVKTPAIDRLAEQGMRFDEAYATSQVCCPSRYGVLTGLYPWRVHHREDGGIWSTHRTPLLYSLYGPDPQTALAAVLKRAGYRTAAVGKWHQGLMNEERDWNLPLKPGPLEAGFDWFFGDASNRYTFYIEDHQVARRYEDDTPIEGFDKALKIPESVWTIDDTKNAAVLNGKACDFIRKSAGDQPFFLYYCPNNVHIPLTPGAAHQGGSEAGAYGDFVQELDWTVGEVIRALEETGERDNTLIVFSSDNGGRVDTEALAKGHRVNRELLGQKTDVWEGGIRVPFIVCWPGTVPGGRQSDLLLSHVDLFPTLCAAAGASLPERHFDGENLLEIWKGAQPAPALADRTIAANVGKRSAHFSVRKGDWVYINKPGSGGVSAGRNSSLAGHAHMYHSFAEARMVNSDINPDGTIKEGAPDEQLYNLADDPGQHTNIIRQFPEQAEAMRAELKRLNKRVVLKQEEGKEMERAASAVNAGKPIQTPDWQAAQQAAFGAHDIVVGGAIGERIDLTVDGNIRKLEIDRDFISPFREKTMPPPPKMRAIQTGFTVEALAYLAALRQDEDLLALGSGMLNSLMATQEADGYLGALPKDHRGRKVAWDTEELGINLNALVTWHHLYGTPGALEAAERLADYVIANWSWQGIHFLTLERGMIRLSETGGNPKYLAFLKDNFFPEQELCRYWARFTGLNTPLQAPLGHGHHLYRAESIAYAMLQLHDHVDHPELRKAADGIARAFRSGVAMTPGAYGYAERSWITQLGRCGVDNPLAPCPGGMRHTGENCAQVWGILLMHKAQVMDLAAGRTGSWWMDAVERTVYNALPASMSHDGRRVRYAMETEGIRTWAHLDTFCCPNNFRLGMGLLPRLMFTTERQDNAVSLHLYGTMEASFDLPQSSVRIMQRTDYPVSGNVLISVDPQAACRFTLSLRIPSWAAGATARLNGQTLHAEPGTYVRLTRQWNPGDQVELHFPMTWNWLAGTYEQEGRAALLRGPVVFCLNPLRNAIPGYEEPEYDEEVITHEQDKEVLLRKVFADGFPDYEDDYALLRGIVIDPVSVGRLEADPTRPCGTQVNVKAKLPGVNGWRELILTDFTDEGGRATHFQLERRPANLIRDPVFSPRPDEAPLKPPQTLKP